MKKYNYVCLESKKSWLVDCLNESVEKGNTKIPAIKVEAMKIYKEKGYKGIDILSREKVFKNYFGY